MSGTVLVGLVSLVAVLFLAVRALKSYRLPFEKQAAMAAAWLVIILVLAFILGRIAT